MKESLKLADHAAAGQEASVSKSEYAEKPTVPAKLAKGRKNLTVGRLLRSHTRGLVLGFLAAAGEAAANLLQPWPLKIVIDYITPTKKSHGVVIGWVYQHLGTQNMAIVKFACVAVLAV